MISGATWPQHPTCHTNGLWVRQVYWSDELSTMDGQMRRWCSFCRGLHPGDLMDSLAMGASLISLSGDPFQHGMQLGLANQHLKFWPQHLGDVGWGPGVRESVCRAITTLSGYWFEWEGEAVRWGRGPRPASASTLTSHFAHL